MESKTKRIAKYMETHKKGITQMQAVKLFDAYRLSAIIFDLKRQGYTINTVTEQYTNYDGRTSRFARYILVSKPEKKGK